MKKKILTAMIAAVLAAMLTACGGGTANTDTAAGSAAAYELDDYDTPVILIARDILGNEIGRQTFTIS